MSQFPPLRLAVLRGLVDLKADLSVLDDPTCPYDPETVGVLKGLLAPKIVEKEKIVEVAAKAGRGRPSKTVELSEEDQEYVRKEIREQIDKLKQLGDGSADSEGGVKLAPNEMVAVARLKGNLIEKLLGMAERAFNVKRMSDFQKTAMMILEDLVDEKGRETFLKRLEPYR